MNFIFHIDIDAFFPSVEKILHPELKDKPIAIGVNKKRAVISSACYVARKYGLHAGMPNFQALQLCPDLIFVTSPMEVYQNYSKRFMNLVKKNVKGNVLTGSIDEVYFLANEDMDSHEKALSLAKKIQDVIYKQLGLTISFGISTDAFLAKMATNLGKPKGISWIYRHEVEQKLWPLSIKDFFGIGRTKIEPLKEMGIKLIGDLAKTDYKNPELKKILGNMSKEFVQKANGNVIFSGLEDRISTKSVSASRTLLTSDVETEEQCLNLLKKLTLQACNQLLRMEHLCSVASIHIKTGNTRLMTYQTTISTYTNDFETIYSFVKELFYKSWNEQPIRLLGVFLNNLKSLYDVSQTFSFFEENKKDEFDPIKNLVFEINKKFKSNVVFKADELIKL